MPGIPSRTKFNTEYMPWLEEDEIESHDNLELERKTVRTEDVVRSDERRFMQFCKSIGWDYKKLERKRNSK